MCDVGPWAHAGSTVSVFRCEGPWTCVTLLCCVAVLSVKRRRLPPESVLRDGPTMDGQWGLELYTAWRQRMGNDAFKCWDCLTGTWSWTVMNRKVSARSLRQDDPRPMSLQEWLARQRYPEYMSWDANAHREFELRCWWLGVDMCQGAHLRKYNWEKRGLRWP